MHAAHSVVRPVVLALARAGLAGCDSDRKITVSGATFDSKGDALAGLHAALAAAAISQAAFDKLRATILKRPS